MKHLKENPTVSIERLTVIKRIAKKLAGMTFKRKVVSRDYSNTRSLDFALRGITPVDLPSYCVNKTLTSTQRHQQQEVGITYRIIHNNGTLVTNKPMSRRDLHREEVRERCQK